MIVMVVAMIHWRHHLVMSIQTEEQQIIHHLESLLGVASKNWRPIAKTLCAGADINQFCAWLPAATVAPQGKRICITDGQAPHPNDSLCQTLQELHILQA